MEKPVLNSDWAREVKRNSVFCDFAFMQNFGYFAQPENEGEADTPYLSLKVNLEIICIPLPLSFSIDPPKNQSESSVVINRFIFLELKLSTVLRAKL